MPADATPPEEAAGAAPPAGEAAPHAEPAPAAGAPSSAQRPAPDFPGVTADELAAALAAALNVAPAPAPSAATPAAAAVPASGPAPAAGASSSTGGAGPSEPPRARPRYDPLGIGRARSAAGTAGTAAGPSSSGHGAAGAAAGPSSSGGAPSSGGRSAATGGAAGSGAAAAGTAASASPPPRGHGGSGAREVELEEGDAVRWFLQWLAAKNHAARRDMPPPGLSGMATPAQELVPRARSRHCTAPALSNPPPAPSSCLCCVSRHARLECVCTEANSASTSTHAALLPPRSSCPPARSPARCAADSTVLTSAFYAMLRLLRPMLDTYHIAGAGFAFASGMFQMVSACCDPQPSSLWLSLHAPHALCPSLAPSSS